MQFAFHENAQEWAEYLDRYDLAELAQANIPAGSTIVLSYVWGWLPDGMTDPMDIMYTTQNGTTVEEAVTMVEALYTAAMAAQGATPRGLYFEGVTHGGGEHYQIIWGS